jgi:hypothetical protein
MANLTDALQQLREERERAQSQVEKLDSAISVLQDLVGGNGSSAVHTSSRGGRVVSAVARRRMAVAQRARWAKGAHTIQDQREREIERHSREAHILSCGPPQDCGSSEDKMGTGTGQGTREKGSVNRITTKPVPAGRALSFERHREFLDGERLAPPL